jgi:hypothetical protein
MSRSNYTDECESDGWALIRWRGAVASAIHGKRGQAFLREMLAALDALPEKILIAESLIEDGAVCAMGSVGAARGIDMTKLDPEDPDQIAAAFGIAAAMAREIEYVNDECGRRWDDNHGNLTRDETPAERFVRVREWVVKQLEK